MTKGTSKDPLDIPDSEDERFGKVVGYVGPEDNMGMYFPAPVPAAPRAPIQEQSDHPDY